MQKQNFKKNFFSALFSKSFIISWFYHSIRKFTCTVKMTSKLHIFSTMNKKLSTFSEFLGTGFATRRV
jgi:hypothetical protein